VIRVADLAASKRFYATIVPHAGIRLGDDEPGRVQFVAATTAFPVIDDDRPSHEHVHLAFPAGDTQRSGVPRAALAAGYEDNGGLESAPVPPGLLRRVRPRFPTDTTSRSSNHNR